MHGLEHWTHYYTDYGREIQKRFFDHFLRGEDKGWDTQARALLNIRRVDGSFERRDEDDWPIPRTDWTRFYLDPARGALTKEPLAEVQELEYEALGDGVTFSTVIEDELELTGPAAAKLFAASTTEDADLFLTLRLLDPRGA